MRKLSEKQWSILEPLLPKQDYSLGGRPRADDKKTVEGIIWVLTTGAQWNEVPLKYGSLMCNYEVQPRFSKIVILITN